MGFDLKLLGSKRCVKEKLQALAPEHVHKLREAFARNPHPRFKKEVCALRHLPWGSLKAYADGIRGADLEKLARFVKITGMLLQKGLPVLGIMKRARRLLQVRPFTQKLFKQLLRRWQINL